MLAKRAKEILILKGKSGIKIPDDELLSELFLEAMLFIATKCVPQELIERYRSPNMKVFRNIGDECFIRVPKKPNFSDVTTHLEIDESLSYAVINEVLFLLNKDTFYRNLVMDLITQHNANEGKDKDDFKEDYGY